MATHVDDTLPHEGVQGASGRALAVGSQAAGRYRIVRLLGTGGMGEVYEAEDLIVGGTVALKTLLPELAGSSSAVERFRREIALARKVTSPNICRLHDVGTHEGRLFITMELLGGSTLADRVKAGGAQPIAEVERIARQLIAGLAALHAAGIVHRDFKTGNVMLVDDRAVITDFGLARSTTDRDATLTAEGGMLGTPAYMAPEQVQARPATAASDIYALGVVLFELATGKLPFREDTAMATATARLSRDPPKPSSMKPGIPAEWDARILRCLARDPTDRFTRVEDVLSLGRPRSRRWFLVVAGLGAAASAFGAWRMTADDEPRMVMPEPPQVELVVGKAKPKYVAVLPPSGFGPLADDPWRVALAIDLHDQLATSGLPMLALDGGSLNGMPDGTVMDLAHQPDPVAAAWAIAGVDAVVRMETRERPTAAAPKGKLVVEVTIERRGVTAERRAFERPGSEAGLLIDDIAHHVAKQFGVRAPRTPVDAKLADYGLLVRHAQALHAMYLEDRKDPLELSTKLYAESPGLARAGIRLAVASIAIGQQQWTKHEVLDHIDRALAIADQILAADQDHALAHMVKGSASKLRYDWPTADRSLQRALELAPTHERIIYERIFHLQAVGKLEESIAIAEHLAAINPRSQNALQGLGNVYYYARDYKQFARHVAKVKPGLDDEHANILLVLEALAAIETSQFEDAVKLADRFPTKDDPYWAANLVIVYAQAGKRAKAEQLRAQVGDRAGLYIGAQMDDALGRYEAAFAALERAIESHNIHAMFLKIDRFSSPLRSHPRFVALMKRVFP